MNMVQGWLRQHLSNPQIVGLGLVLATALLMVNFFGSTLAPFFTAIVVAYLLEGAVAGLERSPLSRGISTVLVWLCFTAFLLVALFAIIPLVTRQLAQALQEVPALMLTLQQFLHTLPGRYPEFVSPAEIDDLLAGHPS
ncbi:MAG: AI-2E family transporter, partial [Oceanococcaceae bacterium]